MRGSHIDRTIFGNIGIITPSTEGGYVGHIPEVPGCITQGETVEECRAMLKDALRGWVKVATEHRRDALDGQAALDEANNRITELEQDLVAQDVLIQEAKQGAERLEAELAAEREKREQAEAKCVTLNEEKKEVQTNFNLFHASVAYILSPGVFDRKAWIEGLININDISKKYREEVLDRIHRMEGALRVLIDESERVYLAKSEENTDLPHLAMAIQLAKAALEEKP